VKIPLEELPGEREALPLLAGSVVMDQQRRKDPVQLAVAEGVSDDTVSDPGSVYVPDLPALVQRELRSLRCLIGSRLDLPLQLDDLREEIDLEALRLFLPGGSLQRSEKRII